jgi:methionyl-tRNA formyltransferase
MKFAFAGNRDIAVWILDFIISKGYKPELLMVTDEKTEEIKKLKELSGLENSRIFYGKPSSNGVIDELKKLDLDYIIGIHYPYIISKAMLEIPKNGFLNLHPAYLPYNRGWHTPSWAILDNTTAGATLHFMSEKLDLGDIIHQKQIDISINDTANSLYQKLKKLELEVFVEAFDSLVNKSFKRIPQKMEEGASHKRSELFEENISKIEFDKSYKFEEIFNRLRALTTSDISEACYFEKDGKKYRVQINITEEDNI